MNGRRIAAIAALLVVSALVLTGCAGTAPPSAPAAKPPAAVPGGTTAPSGETVRISGFAFDPATLEVKAGDTVTWRNEDSVAHTVTGKGWESGDIQPGTSFSKTFDAPGSYSYACSIHPSMTGVVTVK